MWHLTKKYKIAPTSTIRQQKVLKGTKKKQINPQSIKQDHQRWGYSTVTHMEQSVYLAIWKDLNKKKIKEHRKKIEHRNGEGGWAFSFFAASFRAFGAQAGRKLNIFAPLFGLFVNFRQYNKFRPLTISWHFLTSSWQVPDLKSTKKYQKEPKSNQKYSKVLNSTQKYPKVPQNTQSTQKYPNIPKSTQQY